MRTASRDAENEIYDRASELVEAAAGLRRAAAARDPGRAVPSVLACMEDALGNLARACVALEAAAATRRDFADLAAALEDARRASGAARAFAAQWGRDP